MPGPQPARQRRGLLGAGVVIAVLLSATALVVGVVSLVRQPDTMISATTASTGATATDSPSMATSAEDKALCAQVGPLLREVVDDGRKFVALGEPGTPERDGGIPAYRSSVEDWVARIQPILDANSGPPRYLTRTLQSMIDFKRLYANNIRPGPELAADAETWNSGAIAYGGPWEVCHSLGVTW